MPWMQVLWGALAGAAVLFVWGAVCWMALPHHFGDWKPLPDEGAVEAVLAQSPPAPSMYALPHWGAHAKGPNDPAYAARVQRGPNAHLIVLPNSCAMGPGVFLRGFLLQLAVAAFFAALLFSGTLALHGLVRTVAVFALLGAVVHGVVPALRCIWMRYPARPAWTTLLDGVSGFALLGLVLHLLR